MDLLTRLGPSTHLDYQTALYLELEWLREEPFRIYYILYTIYYVLYTLRLIIV